MESDWRLNGQEHFLTNVELAHRRWTRYSQTWDHDHCVFCTDKFVDDGKSLTIGYCTLDSNTWICEPCFNDFKERFGWSEVIEEVNS
jgi:hypothetical protein